VPKKVDHQERRREIAAAVGRIASDRGLQGVSFREVAAEAGVSVSLVQHYFGTKENLLVTTLDIHSAAMADRIAEHLASLRPDAGPLDRVRAVVGAFLPADAVSRAAMHLYHGFAAVALTDGTLRRTEAFRNEASLVGYLAGQLTEAREAGDLADGVDPDLAARALVALVLGLSLGVLLERTSLREANAVVDTHLAQLRRAAP
jgi:AcrR family transcriptional regulator